jgi:hypothetical protein
MFSAYNHVLHMSNSIFADGLALFPRIDVRAAGIYWCSVCKTPAGYSFSPASAFIASAYPGRSSSAF